MLETIKDSLWQQFGASMKMLENAINLWPDTLWDTDKKFFYTVYHTLILTDYYLTIPALLHFYAHFLSHLLIKKTSRQAFWEIWYPTGFIQKQRYSII